MISFNSIGQVPKEFNYWFYNLPIIENPESVFDIVSKDRNFISKRTSDSLEYFYLGGHTYFGQILKLNLPDSLNNVDSSSIELTWGFLSNTGQKNSSKTYSGNFKILRLEYFITDSLTIDKLFDLADKQLSKNSMQNYYTEVGNKGTTDFGIGNEITYANNKKHLQKLTILKKTYLNNSKSLCLEFNIDQN